METAIIIGKSLNKFRGYFSLLNVVSKFAEISKD